LENLKGNRPLGRTEHEWEENIEIKRNGIENCGLNSSASGQSPVVDPREHNNKTLGSVNVGYLLTEQLLDLQIRLCKLVV
jgi:hypothetical protein